MHVRMSHPDGVKIGYEVMVTEKSLLTTSKIFYLLGSHSSEYEFGREPANSEIRTNLVDYVDPRFSVEQFNTARERFIRYSAPYPFYRWVSTVSPSFDGVIPASNEEALKFLEEV